MRKCLALLAVISIPAHALSVPEALSAATGWPMPGQDGTWMAKEYERGRAPGGYHHGSGLGYVNRDRHDDRPHEQVKPDCPPPVPIPGAIWLFASALAGVTIIGRRS